MVNSEQRFSPGGRITFRSTSFYGHEILAQYVKEDLDPTRVMRIVDHPVRMKIIELLATRGPMSWKELSVELGTGTGSLYHHLDTVEKIVNRDQARKYALTPLGEEVYARFRSIPTEN